MSLHLDQIFETGPISGGHMAPARKVATGGAAFAEVLSDVYRHDDPSGKEALGDSNQEETEDAGATNLGEEREQPIDHEGFARGDIEGAEEDAPVLGPVPEEAPDDSSALLSDVCATYSAIFPGQTESLKGVVDDLPGRKARANGGSWQHTISNKALPDAQPALPTDGVQKAVSGLGTVGIMSATRGRDTSAGFRGETVRDQKTGQRSKEFSAQSDLRLAEISVAKKNSSAPLPHPMKGVVDTDTQRALGDRTQPQGMFDKGDLTAKTTPDQVAQPKGEVAVLGERPKDGVQHLKGSRDVEGTAVLSAERTLSVDQNAYVTLKNAMSVASPAVQQFLPVFRQMAEAIRLKSNRAIEVSVNPRELGRVSISMSGTEGHMSVSIQTDRPETAELMRRNLEQLTQEFRDLGYEDVSFSFEKEAENMGDGTRDLGSKPLYIADEAGHPMQSATLTGIDVRI